MKAVTLLGLLCMLASCATFKPKALPDGSYRLQCASTMAQCLHRARKFCGEDGLEVLKKTADEVYGVEGHRTGAEGVEVHFVCGKPRAEPKWQLPPRRARQQPPRPAARTEDGPTQACVPGSTQRCVGPGACEGGQACLPDGSGFGPCDCGESTAPDSSGPATDGGVDAAASGDAGAADAGLQPAASKPWPA
jgi:hypothetical protein